MSNPVRLKVLVAPLDWGLGHTTRCIPVIKALISDGNEVSVAVSGAQKKLLEAEFSALQFIHLPGYEVEYGSKRTGFGLKIITQIPKILIAIKRERNWLRKYLDTHKPDLLISDNRFGLSSKKIFCVFITHQLHIETGFGNFFSRILTSMNYRFINRFNICWIPDFENKNSLAGLLSHPIKLPVIPIRYIGALTRFAACKSTVINDSLMVIISGPEPLRTFFEKKLFDQLKKYAGKIIVVRGLPGNHDLPAMPSNITIYNHLESESLNKAICESEYIICRSGYSSIMDLISLRKKCIMIPTPGQPEQEYLARYLSAKKMILTVKEEDFHLEKCIESAKNFSFTKPELSNDSFENALTDLYHHLIKT
ncbi:MAG: glycosyl transferase family 28 [Bacteroidetes bacterium]|nr:glycosyl transferase family 28 [Bacteroidota bacterium]